MEVSEEYDFFYVEVNKIFENGSVGKKVKGEVLVCIEEWII